ncbi:MAG: LCP family protein [Actinomycetota bacterium]
MDSTGEPGPWGPTVERGRRFRVLRVVAAALTLVLIAGGVAAYTSAQLLLDQAETNLTRVPVPELEEVDAPSEARHFLVVGSDARDELEDEDRSGLSLGDFEGQRSDVMIYVSISADRESISLVSLPRDLLVTDGTRTRKLTETFAGGPDELIRVIRENFGLPVNHYGAVSLGGFIEVVRTLGTVEICLDEPLRDWRAGADFEAGCHDMDATDTLAFVRSRQGERADFERIDRQQIFLRSVISELTEARVLANPRRLSQLVEDVASNVTTDEGLAMGQMVRLANEARGVVDQGMPMTTVPAFPRTIDGVDYMIAYQPGARALFDKVREGEPVEPRGSRDERAETSVSVYTDAGTEAASIVRSTLQFAGFEAGAVGPAPSGATAGSTTRVFEVTGGEQRARWVADTLGVEPEPLPDELTPPDGVDVLVSVGEDALEGVPSDEPGAEPEPELNDDATSEASAETDPETEAEGTEDDGTGDDELVDDTATDEADEDEQDDDGETAEQDDPADSPDDAADDEAASDDDPG